MTIYRVVLALLMFCVPSMLWGQQATPDISGTGSTNYITKWISSTATGKSNIYQSPSTGRIGINTTSPAATFDVANGNILARGVGGFTGSGNSASVFVGDAGHGITAYRGGGLVTYGGTSISAYQASNRVFVQDSTGNVGIGTTHPKFGLDVSTTMRVSQLLLRDNSGGCTVIYADSGNIYSYFYGSC